MLRAHETAIVRLRTHACTENKAKDTAHLVIKFLGGISSFTQSLKIWICHVVISIAVACCSTKAIGPGTHLDVKAIEYSLLVITTSAPVTDHDTVKAPFSLKNIYK